MPTSTQQSQSTPLKSAKEKNSHKLPNTHGLSHEKLIQIHRDERKPGWSWASATDIRDNYHITGQVLLMMHQRYGLPQLLSDRNAKPVYSLPALEHILESVDEMHDTYIEDTNRDRLERLKAEAEDQVREKLRNEFEAKLTASA